MEEREGMLHATHVLTGLSALCLVGSTALAGPEWEEPTGDAGNTLGTAVSVSTETGGPVGVIKGKLDGNSGGGLGEGDFQDMFKIYIEHPNAFEILTVASGLPDPMLFLFDKEGVGLAASNNSGGTFQSLLQAGDPDMPLQLEAGIYYLAITSALSEALGWAGGEEGAIFGMSDPERLSGQWGPREGFSQSPLTGWSNPTDTSNYGGYEMLLQGVGSVVPAPGVLSVFAFGLVVRRRRR
jgi:hypothetical protein